MFKNNLLEKCIKDYAEKLRANGRELTAFSVAEMLIVMLIIGFLVVAMPSLVHKKFEKRVKRGEHGRYECWRDPGNNELYEFYATEKGGYGTYTETSTTAEGEETILLGKQVDRCTFDPVTMAPGATYFSFQAVGGGAGGSYPIYNPNDTTFKDTEHTDSFTIQLRNKCCRDMTRVGNGNPITNNWNIPEEQGFCANEAGPDNGITQETDPDGAYTNICYNYKRHILYFMRERLDATVVAMQPWLEKYWVPVPSTTDVKICSGRGATGSQYFSMFRNELTNDNEYTYYYGGLGGKGICYKIDKDKVTLDYDDYIRVKISDKVMTDNKYFFFNNKANTTIVTSYEHFFDPVLAAGSGYATEEAFVGHYANSTIQNRLPSIHVISDRQPQCVDGMSVPEEGSTGTRKACVAYEGEELLLSNKANGRWIQFDTERDSKCLLTSGFNGRHASEGDGLTNSERQYGAEYMGETAVPGVVNADYELEYQEENPNALVTDPGCNSDYGWIQDGENSYETTFSADTNTYSVKYEAPTFPSGITLSRKYGYDTPTIGYAGTPGQAISMFLPKMTGKLSFNIGKGGTEGTSYTGAGQVGQNGESTIVCAYEEGSADGLCKQTTSEIFLTAVGGKGLAGGEAGNKIYLFGKHSIYGKPEVMGDDVLPNNRRLKIDPVCEFDKGTGVALPLDVNDSVNNFRRQRIDGCLDTHVARDNNKRFAVDSGFYTIIEMDADTKTPSAIASRYGLNNSQYFLPGTGGDGGYTFLRSTNGVESLTYGGHPKEDEINWTEDYSIEDSTGHTVSDANYNAYRCYTRRDSLLQLDGAGNPVDGTGGSGNAPVFERNSYVCKPGKGYPGAVIIVW